MARWRVSFEIDLPTDQYGAAEEWAEFVIGWDACLPGDNPCGDVDLPASRKRHCISRPTVHRVNKVEGK